MVCSSAPGTGLVDWRAVGGPRRMGVREWMAAMVPSPLGCREDHLPHPQAARSTWSEEGELGGLAGMPSEPPLPTPCDLGVSFSKPWLVGEDRTLP